MHQRNQRRQPTPPAASHRLSRACLLLSSLSLALGLGERDALAICAASEPTILWSYPAQGDTGVPTNVDLWVLPSVWLGPASVSRDGVELSALRMSNGFDAGELEPNTTYTFEIDFATYSDGGPPIELTFTTGAGPAPDDPAAAPGEVVASSSAESPLSGRCTSALWAQGCYDQFEDTYYRFAPSGSAKGWVLMTDNFDALWPGECAPTVFSYAGAGACGTLYGIDAAGQLHAAQHVCSEAAAPVPDESPSSTPAAPAAAPQPAPEGEPVASANEAAAAEPTPGSALDPARSRAEAGCSLLPAGSAGARSAGTLAGASALALSLAVLARRRRRSSPAR